MASVTTPSTPAFRRAVTMPPALSEQPRRQSLPSGVGHGGETLFAQGDCRLVSFILDRQKSAPRSRLRVEQEEESAGTLPWTSQSETPIAHGQLYVQRVPEVIPFLSVGLVPKPLFPKSRCWCVDNETKFVMCVGETCYRFELPNRSDEDRQAANRLKNLLATILRYETTPCPFKRGHHVELPESPKTPIKLIPWTPKHQPITSPDVRSGDQARSRDQRGSGNDRGDSANSFSTGTSGESADEELGDETYKDTSGSPLSKDDTTLPGLNQRKTLIQRVALKGLRSATAPPPLRFKSSQASERGSGEESVKKSEGASKKEPEEWPTRDLKGEPEKEPEKEPEAESEEELGEKPKEEPPNVSEDAFGKELNKEPEQHPNAVQLPSSEPYPDVETASIDSFHSILSFHSPVSPLPPSPPQKQQDFSIDVRKTRHHKRDTSEITVTAASFSFPDDNSTPTWPSLDDDSSNSSHTSYKSLDPATDSRPPSPFPQLTPPLPSRPSDSLNTSTALRRRPRAYSPLPLQENLYTPGTAAILHKTCAMLLGPPAQLVALMLNIAAKIAKGVYKGIHQEGHPGYREDETGRERFSEVRDWEETEDEDEEDIDDYGVSLGKVRWRRGHRDEDWGLGWEID